MSNVKNKITEKYSVYLLRELRITWSYLSTPKFNIFLEEIAKKFVTNYVPEPQTATYRVIFIILSALSEEEFINFLISARNKKISEHCKEGKITDSKFSKIIKEIANYYKISDSYLMYDKSRSTNRVDCLIITTIILHKNFNLSAEQIAVLFNKSTPRIYQYISSFNKLNENNKKELQLITDYKTIKGLINEKTK